MFRPMRRFNQQLSRTECEKILADAKTGVLSVLGDGGYPYCVPLNFYCENGVIYFHCAKEGHKLDAIKNEPKVSFCVIEKDDILQEKFTTLFKSVIAFGKAEIVTDKDEEYNSVSALSAKYCPDFKDKIPSVVEESSGRFYMVKINVEHLTGKQGKELLYNK